MFAAERNTVPCPKSIEGIFVYLQTPSRVMIGCNNMRMLTWITQTESQQALFQQKDMKDLLEEIPADQSKEMTRSAFKESLMKITNDSSMMSMIQDPPLDFNEALKGERKKKPREAQRGYTRLWISSGSMTQQSLKK